MVNIGDLASIAIVFVVATVTIAIGLDVVTDVRDDSGWGTTSAEYNATNEGVDGLGNLAERLPILATAVVLGIIIGVLLRVFRVV